MTEGSKEITLAVCRETLKVGCVLVQAAYGCPTGIVSELFHPDTWVLAPKPTLVPFTMTYEKWQRFADLINESEEARLELAENLKQLVGEKR